MDLISVIIPNYNNGHLLTRTVNSVLKQTTYIHEILICDDGSTDNSEEIISGFHDVRIKWINCGKNGMPAIPRNIGIKSATGDWLAFLDSDDEWDSNKIEKQLTLARKKKILAVCCNAYRIIDENPQPRQYFNIQETVFCFLLLLNSNKIICSSVLLNKRLLNKTGGFPEGKNFKAIEDYALWLKIATFTDWHYVDEPLVLYADNPDYSIRREIRSEFKKKFLICLEYLIWNRLRFFKTFIITVCYIIRLTFNHFLSRSKKN